MSAFSLRIPNKKVAAGSGVSFPLGFAGPFYTEYREVRIDY
jgi:hypothetical protein